ncbi:MAG: 4-vinyl reductase [Clostridiales bacterium]|nr:4-vinyl reductase [Clostridiales bacterium]
MEEKYFSWSRIGDIAVGRENLGLDMPVAVYRLLMYNLMDELKERFGQEQADRILYSIGYRSGLAIAANLLEPVGDLDEFIIDLQKRLKDLKIGILRIESVDLENMHIVLTVDEDLDCSGLPVTGEAVCTYDEGLISGLLYHATGKEFTVKEVDCWATGDRTCRFEAYAHRGEAEG